MTSAGVCMLSASFAPTLGGAERQCELLSGWLAGAGIAVAVLTRQRRGGPEALRCPFPVHRLPVGGLGFAVAGACWLASRRRPFDVLHAHQALSPALAAVLAKRLRPKSRVVVKIACSGEWSDFRLAQKRPFYRRRLALLRAVDRFIVLNRESVAELESVGLGHVPAHLIPNGVDVRRFTPPGARERQIARASLGLSSDEPVVLYVGRLERRKGIDLLLAAWAELMSKGSVPRLLIAGAGETDQWIHDAQELGVEKHVTFLGNRGDVVPLYEAADILAFPSRAEGCPNAVLEAMACGLSVVASNVAGNLAVLGEEGRTGCLVPAEDPEALARAVSSLAASPGLRRKIGAEARRAAVERFAIDRIGAQYLSLYQELTG